jgi:hypothetical protein
MKIERKIRKYTFKTSQMSNTTSPAYYCVKHNITVSTVAFNKHFFNFSFIDILRSYHASLYVALNFSDVNMFQIEASIRRHTTESSWHNQFKEKLEAQWAEPVSFNIYGRSSIKIAHFVLIR